MLRNLIEKIEILYQKLFNWNRHFSLNVWIICACVMKWMIWHIFVSSKLSSLSKLLIYETELIQIFLVYHLSNVWNIGKYIKNYSCQIKRVSKCEEWCGLDTLVFFIYFSKSLPSNSGAKRCRLTLFFLEIYRICKIYQ